MDALPIRRVWARDDPIVQHVKVVGFEVPRFGDTRWDLSCLFARPNVEAPVLDFSRLSPEQRLVAKELMAVRLGDFTVSSRRRRIMWPYDPATCDMMMVKLRQVFAFMKQRGLTRLADITQSHLDDRLKALQADFPHPSQRMTIVNSLLIYVWLYESRDHLTGGGLAFDPWGGKPMTKVAGWSMPDETVTPRIPREVLCGLLPWALAYVHDFGKDIIAIERELHDGVIGPPDLRLGSAERFKAYLKGLRAKGAGLPAFEKGRVRVCLDHIGRHANVSFEWLKGPGAEALALAIERFPIELRHLPGWTHVPEGCLEPLQTAFSVNDAKRECIHLTTACYIVCAYLSGMRDCEIQDLRRGCVSISHDETGRPVRYRLKGRVFKGRVPTPEDWVVIEPVAEAIAILEELTEPYHRVTGDDHLFVFHRNEKRVPATVRGHINRLVNRFAAHCSGTLAPLAGAKRDPGFQDEDRTRPQLTAIPDQPDGPWHFTTRQFRKTLAAFIAREPFGVIAGAIQYKHSAVTMFEGYAGRPESGFPEELAAEELDARISDVTSIYVDAGAGIRPVGGMAQELLAEAEAFKREFGPLPGTVALEKTMRERVRHRAIQMRLGILAHCFFEPSQARCLENVAEHERTEPVTGLCRLDCPRACVTRAHRAAFVRLAEEADGWARLNRVPELAREVYRKERDTALAMVKRIDEAGGGQGH